MFSESHLQNSIFDALYCEEDRLDEDLSGGFCFSGPEITDFAGVHEKASTFLFDYFCSEDDELARLLPKEKNQERLNLDEIDPDGSLAAVRDGAVKWMLKVTARYGFTPATAVLAVNCYDRFISTVCFQKDKPWMSQLAAVACISVAAKVEETLVPLLEHLQVEESKFLFEAKTIQRMELLVLSTLQWKMNPVTPLSYFHLVARKLKLITFAHLDILERCENVILSIITDCRLVSYLPSVVASATMLYVVSEMDPSKAVELKNQLVNELKISEEKIGKCLQLVMDVRCHKQCRKRKHEALPRSPSCVVDSYLSSDSSNDSWMVSWSPKPLFKRNRAAQDQHMRLGSENSFSWHW